MVSVIVTTRGTQANSSHRQRNGLAIPRNRDTIPSGKARVMIAGGFDDVSEEGSYEFADMKATGNTETEFAMGCEPMEMSRPATTTHVGVRVL
jgi:3-oxoacyl-(acyl-carrier-protein) synthase